MGLDLNGPFEPDWVSPPGHTVMDILIERSIDPVMFSLDTGLGLFGLKMLFEGKQPIDDELAGKLSSTLGASKQFWINREAHYRADKVRLGL